MDINIFQITLISLFAYLGSLSSPWLIGLTGGWYTITRPLVSGAIIGLILGDVTTGIIVGVAVQTVFIALVTPGGQMPQDLNAAAFIGVTLGILTVQGGAPVGSAVSIATAVGAIGTIFHNFMMITNSFWNHRAIEAIDRGDTRGLRLNHLIYPQVTQFLLRFIPTFAVIYFGQGFASTIIELFPVDSFVMRSLTVLGGLLPAVGVGILLKQIINENVELIRFLLGFTLVAVFGINMITLAIIAIYISYSHFIYTKKNTSSEVDGSITHDDTEEEL